MFTNAEDVVLSDEVHQKIEILSAEGDAFANKSEYHLAIQKYVEALELLPQPIEQWEACTWLLVAIGDVSYLSKNYEISKKALTDAMHCPRAIGNPFVHLRLGQSQLELGNKERASDELARAYMGAGKEIFEPEHPKYFEFLKSVLKTPANGAW